VKAAYVDGEMGPADRQRAYLADVTYCTNKEVAADYLRDRLVLGTLRGLPSALLGSMAGDEHHGLDRLMLRGLECAIVDEADSVLIDEAVTPLIISGDSPNAEQIQAYKDAAQLAGELKSRKDFRVDERFLEVTLTHTGRIKLAQRAKTLGPIWKGMRRREELVRQALIARDLYRRDKQYVVQDGKIVIVDEFTGRLMPDRSWRDGLHQAVEAKEGLEVNPLKGTLARISFQRFFRMYRKLSGMTGTAIENRQELWVIYHLPVVKVPTHKPVIRTRGPDRLYANAQAKFRAIVQEIEHIHQHHRPVLIGSRTVGASEQISQMLHERGLENQVLNAVRHAEEAQIIAGAGTLQRITVATNMAGRGTDIKPSQEVKEAGGVHVIATERHEAGRIDRQLFGRTGRQGDPGSVTTYLSLDDELFTRYAPQWVKLLLAARVHGDGAATGWLYRALADYVQGRAERRAFLQRKSVLKADDWLDEYLGFAGREM
jgi:preprotein translocase subunit SecA